MKTNRKTCLAITFLLTVVISACSKTSEAPKAAAKAIEEPPRPVRTITVAQTAVGDILYLPGEVRPRIEQRYGFRVGGKIARRSVEVGQTVKPGQVLAVMDSADVAPAIAAQTAQVESAKTDLALQTAELKRTQELSAKNFLSAAALDRQKASTDAAQARMNAAQAQLAQVRNGLTFQTLVADKPGVVVGLDAEAGSVVAAGQTVVRVAQSGEREMLVAVPERNLKALRASKQLIAVADAVPGKIYHLAVREIAPTADAASRTYAARLSITNADDALALGMSSTVKISLSEGTGITVPNIALYTRDNTVRVWVVDKASTTVKPVEVKLGESNDTGVIVLSGLKAGDIVVTAGANLLQPGQKVRLLGAGA